MKFNISCDEANHICDKNQYKEASFWEKVRLNVHLIYCTVCRKYSSRNAKLTKKIKSSDLETISLSDKNVMKQQLEEQFKKLSEN